MKNMAIAVVGLALFASLPSVAADNEPTSLEQTIANYSRFDLSQATRTDYTFVVPAGEGFEFTLDWTTGAAEARSLSGVENTQQGAAGCVQVFNSGIWASDPVGVVACPHQFLTDGIARSTLTCAGFSACFMDGINFDFLNFGFMFISCGIPVALGSVGWDGSPTQLINCVVFVFGASPTVWNFWDSIIAGFLGVTAGVHNYV